MTVGTAAKIAVPLLAVAAAFVAIREATQDAAPGIGETTSALLSLSEGIETDLIRKLRESREAFLEQQQSLQDAKNSWVEYKDSFAGTDLSVQIEQSEEFADMIGAVDTALSQLVAGGHIEEADAQTAALAEALGLPRGELDQLLGVLPQYTDALDVAANEQRLAAEAGGPLQDSLVLLSEQYGLTGEDAAAAAQEMLDAWSGAASEFVTLTSDMIETADEYIAALEEQVQAQLDWETNMLAISSRVPAAMLDELARLGPEGAEEVALYASMTDAELAKVVELAGRRTGEATDAMAGRLAEAGPVLTAIAQRHGQAVADRVAAGMAQNSTSVFEEAKRQGVLIDRGVGTDRVRRAPIAVDVTGIGEAERQLNTLARNRAAAIRVTVSTGVRVAGFTGQGGTTLQHGTDYAPGGVALVGEQGPELVEIPRGSRVHDAATTSAILANPRSVVGSGHGGGGSPINAHIEVTPTQARSPLLFAALREVARNEALEMQREVTMRQRRGGRH